MSELVRICSVLHAAASKTKSRLLFLLHHVCTVIFSSNHFEFDSRQVLSPATLHQHHVVLLQVVSFSRDEDHSLLAVRQPHSRTLPVCGVGLLGLSDHGLQDDGLQLGPAKRGAHGRSGRFGLSLTVHLVEGGHGPGRVGGHPGRCMLGDCGQQRHSFERWL